MKVVLYLSGKARSRQFHAEQDSVADSVEIPAALESAFINMALEIGALNKPLPASVGYADPLPTIQLEAFLDVFSDLEDDVRFGDAPDPLLKLSAGIGRLVNSECSCGVYHIVK